MTVPNVAFPTFLKKLAIAASFYLFLPIQPHDDSVMIFIPQPLCKGLFYNGTNRPIFAYFYSFQILMLHKKWNLQGIQTRIVVIEGKHDDQLIPTTALDQGLS